MTGRGICWPNEGHAVDRDWMNDWQIQGRNCSNTNYSLGRGLHSLAELIVDDPKRDYCAMRSFHHEESRDRSDFVVGFGWTKEEKSHCCLTVEA